MPPATWLPEVAVVASAGGARLFDVQSHRLAHVLDHGAGITTAAFSPDGRLALTADGEGALRLWSAQTGGLVRTLRYRAPIAAAGFGHEGKLVFAGGGSGVRIWRTATGDLIASWAELVKLLEADPGPDVRECPVCHRTVMREATRCGYCWTKMILLA